MAIAGRDAFLLEADSLTSLPDAVRRPAYDRRQLKAGMAHIGVGAFHRCHQAEYTDDMLENQFGRWGVVGINIRPPALASTLGEQDGLYTRLIRETGRSEPRVIGSIVQSVDSQEAADPALTILASRDIDVVTMTVTEKGYCHIPSTGELDPDLPDISHDIADPERPRTLPGILMRALELRKQRHGSPITLISCDNIPGNGAILANVVRTLAERRGAKLAGWIDSNVAFPSSMVDRIAPATTQADLDTVEREFGYRDAAVVVGEAFRQWVIEDRFAGRRPSWNLAGATFVPDVTPYEHIKMRVLNGAQTTLAYLGVLTGQEHTFDAIGDPLLERFVRRMLIDETISTLPDVPDMEARPYVEQSLARLHNTAIRHRCHQIATDGSQKIVQRLLNPIRERGARGQASPMLATAVAGWMAYLIRASDRFGRQWKADDPFAGRIAALADKLGDDAPALADAILRIDAIFHPVLAADKAFRRAALAGLTAFLSPDPRQHIEAVS